MNQYVNEAARVSRWRLNRTLLRRLGVALLAVVVLALSWRAAEIRPSVLFQASTIAAVLAFLGGLFPPDLSPDFLRIVIAAMGRTVAMAVAGTALSIILGLPLGVMATATLWRRGVLLAGEHAGIGTSLLAAASRATRALLGFLRAVPDLMWGVLLVVAVGLGSLAGALALAVSYCGVLGRVYADVFEEVAPQPLEALHSTGATRAQVFLRAIWPQAAPNVTAYTLYSFECCMRAASVLGFIGAGGIGYEINVSMRLFEYGQVLTLIAGFIGLVAATEALSRFLRRRLRANAPAGSLAHQHLMTGQGAFGWLDPSRWLTNRTLVVLGSVLVIASFYATGLTSGQLIDAGLPSRLRRFIGGLFPPDFDPAFLKSLGQPLLQTIGISVMGTLIGVTVGAVLALPATSTLIRAEPDEADQRTMPERAGRWLVYTTARLVLSTLRSIPEIVWVLICIISVGLGAFAGTLAVGLHTGGVLGKLYAETLEEVPAQPIEALRAAGARPLQILIYAIWPQARPMLASYTTLRWEMNLRISTVLGLVGGGGLGQAIYNNVQLGFYHRVTTLIVLVYLLVVTTDWISDRLRARPVAA